MGYRDNEANPNCVSCAGNSLVEKTSLCRGDFPVLWSLSYAEYPEHVRIHTGLPEHKRFAIFPKQCSRAMGVLPEPCFPS